MTPAPYQPQLMCAAKARPGVVKLRALALATYGRGGTSPATPRSCASGSASEHKDGRAWDWMLNHANKADRRVAANFLGWITADDGEMAARLGIMYVIYNRKIWASYSPGWRDYTGPTRTRATSTSRCRGTAPAATPRSGPAGPGPLDYGACQVFAGQPAVVADQEARARRRATHRPRRRNDIGPAAALDRQHRHRRRQGAAAARASPSTRTFDRATRRRCSPTNARTNCPRTGALDDPTWASLLPTSIQASKPAWTPAAGARWAATTRLPRRARGRCRQAGLRPADRAAAAPRAMRTSYYGRATRAGGARGQGRARPARTHPRDTGALGDAAAVRPKTRPELGHDRQRAMPASIRDHAARTPKSSTITDRALTRALVRWRQLRGEGSQPCLISRGMSTNSHAGLTARWPGLAV